MELQVAEAPEGVVVVDVAGSVDVYTAAEFKHLIREGAELSAADVDVVTTGTTGVMSGTAAILSVPVAEPTGRPPGSSRPRGGQPPPRWRSIRSGWRP